MNSETAIPTASGVYIDLLDPDPALLRIGDIARGLSNCCRFSGQMVHFYSVAQHSLHCSEIVSDAFALEALLHDAAEAFIHDITRPLKHLLPDYRSVEARWESAIRVKFRLPQRMSAQVTFADRVMLATERRDLLMKDDVHWPELDGYPPLDETIRPYAPAVAHHEFMRRFEELTGGKR